MNTYMTLNETKEFLSLSDAEILENIMQLGFPLPRDNGELVLGRFFLREEIEHWIDRLTALKAG